MKSQGYSFLMLGILLFLGTAPVRAESSGRHSEATPAVISAVETSQTALAWFPDADVVLGRRTGVAASLLFSLFLFFAMGYTWQALDEEEFPDSDLPGWFVSAFRRRKQGFDPRRL